MPVNKAQTEKGESSWNSTDSPLKEGNIREGFLAVEQGVNKAKGIGRAARNNTATSFLAQNLTVRHRAKSLGKTQSWEPERREATGRCSRL